MHLRQSSANVIFENQWTVARQSDSTACETSAIENSQQRIGDISKNG